MPETILVADDERRIRDVVQYALEREGYCVRTAADGRAALELVARERVDLLILDVLMPELDGLSACRQLRAQGDLPIIFLSSRTEEVDRVLGLELGGDDYVCKPFSPRELATRVRAVLRRAHRDGPAVDEEVSPTLVLGALEIDLARHAVRVGGTPIALTATEFALLRALAARPGRLLSRSQLIDLAYGGDHHITERTIDTHVRRIRAKLRAHGRDPIETVHGLGYRAREI